MRALTALRPAVLAMWVLAVVVLVLGVAQGSTGVVLLGVVMSGVAGWRTRVNLDLNRERPQ